LEVLAVKKFGLKFKNYINVTGVLQRETILSVRRV